MLVAALALAACDSGERDADGDGGDTAAAAAPDLSVTIPPERLTPFCQAMIDLNDELLNDPPADPRDYLHRSGRTARAGESGVVVTLLLWNEELEIRRLQRRIGLNVPIVEMFSNDPRLGDLAGWDPQPHEAVGAG